MDLKNTYLLNLYNREHYIMGKVLHTWEEMRKELNEAKDGHTFNVKLDHNAFLLKDAINRRGIKNTTINIVRGNNEKEN